MKISENLKDLINAAIAVGKIRIYEIPRRLRTKSMEFIDKSVHEEDGAVKTTKKIDDTKFEKILLDGIRKGKIRLRDIPSKFATHPLCLAAVLRNADDMQYVPNKVIDQDFCNEVLTNGAVKLNQVPAKFLSIELCLDVIERKETNTTFVPNGFQSEWFYMEALSRNPKVVGFIPARYQTPAMYMHAIVSQPENFFCVPPEIIRPDMVCYALKYIDEEKRAKVIDYCPEWIRDSFEVAQTIKQLNQEKQERAKQAEIYENIPRDIKSEYADDEYGI